MIDISSLCLTREGASVLRDIDVQIPATGITDLIGPNGAGKSSLLHCIAGLVAPTSGSVRIDGADNARLRIGDRARRVALLTQDQAAIPRLTVEELVAFGRWPHHRGRPRQADLDATEAALDTFDLGSLRTRSIDTLSGGQRQRAFVAMTYAQGTRWMLLDEPLAALDPRFAKDIMIRVHALTRPGPDGRAAIVVLHDLSAALRYADHCIALKEGRLQAAGPRRETMTTPMLTRLFETDLSVEQVSGREVLVSH